LKEVVYNYSAKLGPAPLSVQKIAEHKPTAKAQAIYIVSFCIRLLQTWVRLYNYLFTLNLDMKSIVSTIIQEKVYLITLITRQKCAKN